MKKNHTSYKDVKSYNLDEYFGLDASHPQSYHYFMYKNLFNGIDIKDEMYMFHVVKEIFKKTVMNIIKC